MRRKKILIVEDESILAIDLQKQLQNLGYAALSPVASGVESVVIAIRDKPDLILMDVRIKGRMDGIEAARTIKKRLDIPILYLTAYSNPDYLSRAKLTHPAGYLIKPVNRRELAANIEMAFYKHAADKKLKKSEAYFVNMLGSIGDAVITTDARGRIRFMNAVSEKLTGWRSAEAKGKQLSEVCSWIDENSGERILFFVPKIISGRSIFVLPMPTLMQDRHGNRMPVQGSLSPIIEQSGKPIGSIVVFRDVTEYHRMERQILDLEKYRIYSQISSGVAHEVRNPLNAILAVTEALVQEIGENATTIDYLKHIRDQVRRLADLMRDLLDLGKPIRPSDMKDESPISICEETLFAWRQSASVTGVDVNLIIPESFKASRVKANAGRLQQAIFNLLENSARNSPPGSRVELSLSLEEGERVVFRIKDPGTGIPEKDLERVFNPFYTTRPDGTGLGLSIVKSIVEQHGGTVRLRNNDHPPGCTAEIQLPLSDG